MKEIAKYLYQLKKNYESTLIKNIKWVFKYDICIN